jgi:hypothetical protein
MAGPVGSIFRNSRVDAFLCALAGVSPLVGVQAYAWDCAMTMFYYFAEAMILMLIGFGEILCSRTRATPDGTVRVMPGGKIVVTEGNVEWTASPMTKGTALTLFFMFSGFMVGFSFIYMNIAFVGPGRADDIFHLFASQWPLLAAATAGLLCQHGYHFVSDFWLGPRRSYPPGIFVGKSFFRTLLVFLLVFSVKVIADFTGPHFALVMAILIGARALVQILLATRTAKRWMAAK